MLKRVTIENYRSCLKTVIDLHPNLSVLIGPNSSGKTNILQAIMLLYKLAADEPHHRRHAITVNSRIKAAFEHRNTRIQLRASVDTYPDEANNDVILLSREKWVFTEKNKKRASFEMPLAFAAQYRPEMYDFYSVHWGHSRRMHVIPFRSRLASETAPPAWTRSSLRNIAQYCKGMRYYGASQFTNPGTCPPSFQIEQEQERRMLFRTRGHIKFLYNLYSASKTAADDKYQQFLDIVGPRGLRLIDAIHFREVPTSSLEYSVRVGGRVEVRKRHRRLIVPQFRIGRQKLSPNQLSEGTFKTLALLFHVLTEDSTALLIEEPEVCVHQGLLSSILELIKSASLHKQMIISTHSDHVLDHVAPENVYRVNFDKEAGTAVHHIPKSMTPKELFALREYLDREGNLGEYWREGGLGDRP